MVTLGIETSCDETGAAVVKDGEILSNIVSSSIPLHAKFGGVIPEIASRCHIEYINLVTKSALKRARIDFRNVDLIAVTDTPGLPGSLLVGSVFARALSYSLEIPLVSVNHLTAHLYANFLTNKALSARSPFIGVVVSGGHTNIFICKSFEDSEIIGRTKDDAMGEAFDKVAKILGIGYPGGPKIERCAKRIKGTKFNFPRVYLEEDSFDFSLSGVKTAVLYHVKNRPLSRREISRICWAFQEAVFDVLTEKIVKACKKFKIRVVLLGGGVIANMRLRAKLRLACKNFDFDAFYPPPALCVDNGAMVAGLGEALYRIKSGDGSHT